MFYYQYDAILQDGIHKQHVGYVLKSTTCFKGKEMAECQAFQREYLATTIKHDSVVSDMMTLIPAAGIDYHMKRRGMSMESIPQVQMHE
jgi:hypothetical protein